MREILPSDPIRAGRVDVGMLWLPVRESDLAVRPALYAEPLVPAVAPDRPLAGPDRVEMEDLNDYPAI